MFKKALLLILIALFLVVIIVISIYHTETDYAKLPNDVSQLTAGSLFVCSGLLVA